jgi:hypothetical protein
VFSPHCAQYPGMHAHVAAAGLSAAVGATASDDGGNMWDRAVHIHSRAGPTEGLLTGSGERDRTCERCACCAFGMGAGCWVLCVLGAGYPQSKFIYIYIYCVCWLLGAGYVVLGAGCWVLGAGCWVLGAGCWVLCVLGAGCWVLGAVCWVLGAGCC